MGRHIMNVVLIVTRRNPPTRIWNNIVVDVQSISMRIFLTISTVSVSLGILYPPWGTQFLLVAVLNLCLHLMDLKTEPNVQRLRTKKPVDIKPPPSGPETPPDTPYVQDVLKGLSNIGIKKSEAVRLVLQVRRDNPSLRDTGEILKRCITLSYRK